MTYEKNLSVLYVVTSMKVKQLLKNVQFAAVGAEKFVEQSAERSWAAEHVVGVAQGVSEDILADLRANFEGECSEVWVSYLAMARVCSQRRIS